MCLGGWRSAQISAMALVSLCLAAGAFSGETGSGPAGAERKGWELLHLSETTIDGVKVYYEKDVEAILPFFERELTKYLAKPDQRAGVLAKRDEILADINGILGMADPNDCRDLAPQINLRYWMLGNYCPYVSDVPVKTEAEIQHARYAYSLFEARRLIEKHGIGCVREILDKIAVQDSRTGIDLVRAIREVTGEDMDQRLGRYQMFATEAEGNAKYAAAAKAGPEGKDREQMFFNVMRLMELQRDAASNSYLDQFLAAAMLLFQMGHEEAADQAMQNCIMLYSQRFGPEGRKVALRVFAVYSLQTNRRQMAEKTADELLLSDANDVYALNTKMILNAQNRRLDVAKEFARRIRRLRNPNPAFYRNASQILALDSNQPPAYNGPVGPK